MKIKSKYGEPPRSICSICGDKELKDFGYCRNNINHSDYENGDIYDCCDYSDLKTGRQVGSWMIEWIKRLKENKMYKFIILFFLIGCAEPVTSTEPEKSKETRTFEIELLNERGYRWSIEGDGVYLVEISDKGQSIFKMKGTTNSPYTERISWEVKGDYWWSNGLVTDLYPVINPTSYTKNKIGYSMIGLLPEMKNTDIVIYGNYYSLSDSVLILIR